MLVSHMSNCMSLWQSLRLCCNYSTNHRVPLRRHLKLGAVVVEEVEEVEVEEEVEEGL